MNRAFDEIKSFGADEWEGDYRTAKQQARQGILETKIPKALDVYLEKMRAQGISDWHNGSYLCHLLSEEDLELSVPRSRTFSSRAILKKFATGCFL